jgi:hypothetical protein
MNKKYIKTVVTLAFLLVVDRVFSQGPPPPPPPIDTPIDGGIFLLMAAGITYAVKSIWDRKK